MLIQGPFKKYREILYSQSNTISLKSIAKQKVEQYFNWSLNKENTFASLYLDLYITFDSLDVDVLLLKSEIYEVPNSPWRMF